MDPDLKQRLVGAAVVTSLAAIFVPMLFDDPIDQTGKMISELKIPDEAVKSMDLDSLTLPETIDEVISLPETKSAPETQTTDEEIVGEQPETNLVRWFLQAGTFSEKDNAVSLQNKIRKQGFPASLSIISGDNGMLYKVRIGPELDRKRLEVMKAKIDKLNNLTSIVTTLNE